MGSFADMKKNRRKNVDKLRQKVQDSNKAKNSNVDERFWDLTVDKAGIGAATIRFLPPSQGEDTPFVQTFSHGFKGPGGWYIENCLSTVGKDDPVNEFTRYCHDNGLEEKAKGKYRVMKYVSNILVVDDPAKPENNGKVFLFRYGKQVMDILNDFMFPEDEDEEGVVYFDLWEGANFKLKAKPKGGFRNYQMSKFLKAKPAAEDDAELEALWNTQHKLGEFTDPSSKHFKSYDQLKQRLIQVVGRDALLVFGGNASLEEADDPELEDEEDIDELPTAEADIDDGDDELPFDIDDDDGDDDLPFDLDDDDEDDDLESFNDLVN